MSRSTHSHAVLIVLALAAAAAALPPAEDSLWLARPADHTATDAPQTKPAEPNTEPPAAPKDTPTTQPVHTQAVEPQREPKVTPPAEPPTEPDVTPPAEPKADPVKTEPPVPANPVGPPLVVDPTSQPAEVPPFATTEPDTQPVIVIGPTTRPATTQPAEVPDDNTGGKVVVSVRATTGPVVVRPPTQPVIVTPTSQPTAPPAKDYAKVVGQPRGKDVEFVTSLFQCLYHREPQRSEVLAKLQKLWKDKADRGAIIRAMVNSDEYRARKTSNREYVQDLYQACFGRDLETVFGWEAWVKRLDKGTKRERVLEMFLLSSGLSKTQ